MAVKRNRPTKKRDQARLLSASVIGAAALALVGGVAYVQMKQGDNPVAFLTENPSPPPNLAKSEAARAAAEKRLADAMAIQIINIPSIQPQAAQAAPASLVERPMPVVEKLARADIPAPPQPPLAAPPAPAAPLSPAGMSTTEQEALLNRVNGLLGQGDIGAARAVLNRLVRENNPKAAFILAQSYDPAVLKQGRVVGMRADPDLARNLYAQALRGGVTEAKAALDSLPRVD